MTDDIVTRLRRDVPFWIDELGIEFDVMSEAADEIERLRTEVARLGAFVHPIGMVINAKEGKNFDAEKIAELVAKAVRGGL